MRSLSDIYVEYSFSIFCEILLLFLWEFFRQFFGEFIRNTSGTPAAVSLRIFMEILLQLASLLAFSNSYFFGNFSDISFTNFIPPTILSTNYFEIVSVHFLFFFFFERFLDIFLELLCKFLQHFLWVYLWHCPPKRV